MPKAARGPLARVFLPSENPVLVDGDTLAHAPQSVRARLQEAPYTLPPKKVARAMGYEDVPFITDEPTSEAIVATIYGVTT